MMRTKILDVVLAVPFIFRTEISVIAVLVYNSELWLGLTPSAVVAVLVSDINLNQCLLGV
jgi:hypothetical protein